MQHVYCALDVLSRQHIDKVDTVLVTNRLHMQQSFYKQTTLNQLPFPTCVLLRFILYLIANLCEYCCPCVQPTSK